MTKKKPATGEPVGPAIEATATQVKRPSCTVDIQDAASILFNIGSNLTQKQIEDEIKKLINGGALITRDAVTGLPVPKNGRKTSLIHADDLKSLETSLCFFLPWPASRGVKHESIAELEGKAEAHRDAKTPMAMHTPGEGAPATRLTSWAAKKTWTPWEAALLVTGFDPRTYTKVSRSETATRLDGSSPVFGPRQFEQAREYVDLWDCTIKTARATPAEFMGWFRIHSIDTAWLSTIASPEAGQTAGGQTREVAPADNAELPPTAWCVKRPQKMDAISRMTFQALTEALCARKPKPKATEVFTWIEKNRASDFLSRFGDELKFVTDTGSEDSINEEAMRKRIWRMTE